jgi:hypothetical protein
MRIQTNIHKKVIRTMHLIEKKKHTGQIYTKVKVLKRTEQCRFDTNATSNGEAGYEIKDCQSLFGPLSGIVNFSFRYFQIH